MSDAGHNSGGVAGDQLRSIVDRIEWRVCPNFSKYEVSECGDVRWRIDGVSRKSGYRPKGHINCDGYLAYSLTRDDGVRTVEKAHRLVIQAFVGPPPGEGYEVAHNNGSRVDNHVTNLRWATRASNHSDIQIHGTSPRGTRNGRATITEDDVRAIRAEYREIKASRGRRKVGELDEKYGLCRSQIIKIAKRQQWAHVE